MRRSRVGRSLETIKTASRVKEIDPKRTWQSSRRVCASFWYGEMRLGKDSVVSFSPFEATMGCDAEHGLWKFENRFSAKLRGRVLQVPENTRSPVNHYKAPTSTKAPGCSRRQLALGKASSQQWLGGVGVPNVCPVRAVTWSCCWRYHEGAKTADLAWDDSDS